MRIGYFNYFKGENTVLLDCDSSEIVVLKERLKKFTSSTDQSMLVQGSRNTREKKSVELFLVASAISAKSEKGTAFSWLCTRNEVTEIMAMLSSLIGISSGHHYIELLEPNTQLIISTGEYGDSWWGEHG